MYNILDEIELALHPSSLKRLVAFLEDMAKQYDYAIYFLLILLN